MIDRRIRRLALWLVFLQGIVPLLVRVDAITPENVAIIPKLGELGMPDEAFSPMLERLPEHGFADPWAIFGEDWLLKPCLAVSWAQEETDRLIVLNSSVPNPRELQTIISGEPVALTRISSHLRQVPGCSSWRDLLASPFTVLPNGQKEGLYSSYDLVHWIRNQHAFLSGNADAGGPKGILVSVYSSRRDAADALLTGEIDALDDLFPEERKRIHVARADVQLVNRRSNELLYLLWNPKNMALEQAETRGRLEALMDKRRIASRAGSRAAWATSCPIPVSVPGAWSSSTCGEYSAGEEAVLPDSLIVWTDDTSAAVTAGIEVARDLLRHGISVRRFTAPSGGKPWHDPSIQWSAWIGSYAVSPGSLLPSVQQGSKDLLAACRGAAVLNQGPSVSVWADLSERLRVCLETERSIVFLCWLPRWGAVSKRWLIPDPTARSLLNDVARWSPVPHLSNR